MMLDIILKNLSTEKNWKKYLKFCCYQHLYKSTFRKICKSDQKELIVQPQLLLSQFEFLNSVSVSES